MAAPDADIGDGCRSVERAQEDSTNGHWVQDAMENANPFSSREVRYFERTFDFSCPEMPTSFYFRVSFLPSLDKSVTSVASVKRTDQGSGLVKVTLSTTVRRAGAIVAYLKHSFPELGAGKVGREVTLVVLHQNEQILQRASDLLVDFVLTIERCHSEQEGEEEAMDTRDSEDSSPKKRICVQSSS